MSTPVFQYLVLAILISLFADRLPKKPVMLNLFSGLILCMAAALLGILAILSIFSHS